MKDNVTLNVKQTNWTIAAKDLKVSFILLIQYYFKKFGIKINAEKKAKIIEGRHLLINDILNKLFDFDNGGGPNSTRH